MKNSLFNRAIHRHHEMSRLRRRRTLTKNEAKTLFIAERVILRGFRRSDRRALDSARKLNASLAKLEQVIDDRAALRRAERENSNADTD